MFINILDFLRYKIWFNFLIGGRGVGKTFSTLKGLLNGEIKKLLEQLEKKKGIFIYLRTSTKELEVAADSNVFSVVDKRIKWRKLEEDFYAIEKNNKLIGYGCALSTFKNIRGVNFENVDIIFHDEFIPELSSRRILKDEANAFFNLIESVNRNREIFGHDPILYIACANANNIYNPYFVALKIVDKVEWAICEGSNRYIDYERGLQVVMLKASPEYVEAKRKTALYKLTAGTDFEKMALDNEFSYNDFSLIKKNVKVVGCIPVLKIDDIVIWKKKNENNYIARYSNVKIKKTFKSSDDLQRRIFFKNYREQFYLAILNENMFFDNYEIKKKIFDILKIKC